MSIRHFLTGALLTVGAAGAARAQQAPILNDSLSLDGTLQSVLDANPGITTLEEQVNAATGRAAQSRTGYLPYVTGTASYTYLNPVAKAAFPAGPGGEVQTLQFVPYNNYDVHITAQYQLLDFGKNNASVHLSESQIETARDNVVITRRDLAFSAAQTYYNILFAREAIRVQDDQIASLRRHQNEMEQRVQGGVSTQYDVTTTKVRIAQSENARIDQLNQLLNQEAQLARLLHRPATDNMPVRGRFAYNPQPVDLTDALTRAAENRPEVKQARDAQKTAELQQALIEKSNLPSLGTGVQIGGKNGYQPDIYQFRANTAVVAQLSVPIFDGNRNRNQRVEAAASVRAAQARILDVQEQIRADVRQAVNNLNASAARYDNSEVQITQAADAYSRAQDRYRYGVGPNLDVLDAETQLAQARLARLQAIYNYTLGQYQLRRATGEQIWK